MIKYLAKVKSTILEFNSFDIQQVPREDNTKADALSRLASSKIAGLRKTVFVEILSKRSIEEAEEILELHGELSWVDPILSYLEEGKLPVDKKEARKVIARSSRHTIVGGQLYKRLFTLPYLRCLRMYEAEYALWKVHKVICGQHLGAGILRIRY